MIWWLKQFKRLPRHTRIAYGNHGIQSGFHIMMESTTPSSISFPTTSLKSRQYRLEGKDLPWTHGRNLIERENFSNWEMDGTQSFRNHNIKDQCTSNVTEEDVNIFKRLFQENLIVFHNKDQVCKSRLQSCPNPSRVGHVIHCVNNIQSK